MTAKEGRSFDELDLARAVAADHSVGCLLGWNFPYRMVLGKGRGSDDDGADP